jgi:plastocyanin
MRPTLAICSLLAATAAFRVADAPASPVRSASVFVKDIEFKPGTLHVKRHTRVTWNFRDPYTMHNVKSRGKKRFASSPDEPENANYSVTFKKAGTYRYKCTLHPNMTGRVVVG